MDEMILRILAQACPATLWHRAARRRRWWRIAFRNEERYICRRSEMPYVYILRCADGSLYAGAAKDLTRRFAQHEAGRASRYTRARLPVVLVWSRRVRSWSDALRTEHRIKLLRRPEKDALLVARVSRRRDFLARTR